jgi:hypothetical protein
MPDVTSNNLVKETGLKKDAMGAVLVTVSTTAALAAIANAVNTTGKYKGKMVFNETTGILVVAADTTAAAVWKNAGSGATAHTPA